MRDNRPNQSPTAPARKNSRANGPRLPRIERDEIEHIEDETTHLWAISYADFLMVLLSFFVIFFAVDQEEGTYDLIQKIAAKTDADPVEKKDQASVSPVDEAAIHAGVKKTEKIQEVILTGTSPDMKVSLEKQKKKLMLYFPDNVYGPGQFAPDRALQTQIRRIVENLRPYIEDIEITFVGHTDQAPMLGLKQKIMKNNFDLSVIRATRALQFALGLGLPPARVAAKGSAQTRRNSRTLSMVVEVSDPDEVSD